MTMRVEYSTLPLVNPVFRPTVSRFAVFLVPISASANAPSGNRHRTRNSPIYCTSWLPPLQLLPPLPAVFMQGRPACPAAPKTARPLHNPRGRGIGGE